MPSFQTVHGFSVTENIKVVSAPGGGVPGSGRPKPLMPVTLSLYQLLRSIPFALTTAG